MIPLILSPIPIAIISILFCLGVILWIAGLCDLLDRVRAYIDEEGATL